MIVVLVKHNLENCVRDQTKTKLTLMFSRTPPTIPLKGCQLLCLWFYVTTNNKTTSLQSLNEKVCIDFRKSLIRKLVLFFIALSINLPIVLVCLLPHLSEPPSPSDVISPHFSSDPEAPQLVRAMHSCTLWKWLTCVPR